MTSEASDPMVSGADDGLDNQSHSSLRLCGARTRQGGECRHIAMPNGRCRFHGGLSTGPRTAEGLARMKAAHTTHGQRGQEARRFRQMIRDLQAGARRLVEIA